MLFSVFTLYIINAIKKTRWTITLDVRITCKPSLSEKIIVEGAKQAELDYRWGLDAQCQSCALFLGGLGACPQEKF